MKFDSKRAKRTLIWVVVQLALLAAFFMLLRYRPLDYTPGEPDETGRVSAYLTHELLQDLYNNVQRGESFELVVEEEGLRNVLASFSWPGASGETELSRPVVYFRNDHIVAMITATTGGMDFVASFHLVPEVDEQGLLNIVLDQANVGAVPMTPVVAGLAQKMYLEQTGGFVGEDLMSKVVDALFRQEPVDSRFVLDGKAARINSVTVEEGLLRIGFEPVR